MKVTRNHVFTSGTQAPKGNKKAPNLSKPFKKGAPINMSSRPLAGRVTKTKGVTKRGDNLSKRVGKILKGIPTPFLVNSKGSSSRGN